MVHAGMFAQNIEKREGPDKTQLNPSSLISRRTAQITWLAGVYVAFINRFSIYQEQQACRLDRASRK